MKTYIQFELEDSSTLLVETDEQPEETGGTTKIGLADGAIIINSANQKFEKALTGVKQSAKILRQQLMDLRADEVEVTFGLKAIGEAGNFAVGKVGVEANYTVKLKWANKTTSSE